MLIDNVLDNLISSQFQQRSKAINLNKDLKPGIGYALRTKSPAVVSSHQVAPQISRPEFRQKINLNRDLKVARGYPVRAKTAAVDST